MAFGKNKFTSELLSSASVNFCNLREWLLNIFGFMKLFLLLSFLHPSAPLLWHKCLSLKQLATAPELIWLKTSLPQEGGERAV